MMIALIQRVSQASVRVEAELVGTIGIGLLALVCAEREDREREADALLERILDYRVFADQAGRMNRGLRSVEGGLLLVPQFTLAADTSSGRRRCLGCDKRFTTYERVELALPSIVKRGGSRAEYDRNKLRASMLLALRKRPVPREAVDDAIGRIEDKLLSSAQREVKSEKLGELVMRELKRLDKVAYIRFASVYRSFEDVDEFAEVVKEVRPPRRRRA